MEMKAHHLTLAGTNYEVGTILGKIALSIPGLSDALRAKEAYVSRNDEGKMYQLFNEYCPGINEEVAGFADALDIPAFQVLYYAMTYLVPGCSQMAILPSKTESGHTLLARNYDFGDKVEELMLTSTRIKGKYAHIGFSIMQFGRCDGMNEHGLAVSQTSAGLPVGNFEFAAKPAIVGLQFWAVIRSVLENCKNVEDVIRWTENMPIAYNINLMVADKTGHAALIESFNGQKAIKEINATTEEQFIHSTNHVHLPELKAYAPLAMKNSLIRYQRIHDVLANTNHINDKDVKKLLSTKFPEGLCCHYYDDFFGTLHSMIFDVNEGTADVCFGSPRNNLWYQFTVCGEAPKGEYPVNLQRETSPVDFYTMEPGC